MTRVTQKEEIEQFESHKYAYKKTPEDKAYQTFLNSIFDEEGNLYKIGGQQIPETVVEINRVYNPEDGKEYLVYDINQNGYFEDGTSAPTVHLQDIGMYKEYEWEKRQNPQPVYTGSPQKRTFKDVPIGSSLKYNIPFTKENLEKIKKRSKSTTRLYVYDAGKSGKGGKDGRIGVERWEDFENRTFRELLDSSYLIQTQMALQMQALKDKENYLNAREALLKNEETNVIKKK